MSVLLLILKILGIILVTVLGILLLVVILVLFSPVRYSVSGIIKEEKRIFGKAYWFCHILFVPFTYEHGAFTYEFRLFGFRWKKRCREVMEEAFDEEEEDHENGDLPERWEVGQAGEFHGEQDLKSEQAGGSAKNSASLDSSPQEMEASVQYPHDSSRRTESWHKKIKNPFSELWKRICQFFQRMKNEVQRFWYTVVHLKDKITDIKNLLTDETNKKAAACGFSEMKYLLRHFRFRKIETDLTFSLGDPALTGQFLGVLCLFPALYRYAVSVYPDFESEKIYAEGTFSIKGHMRMIHFIASFIRLWKKKEFRIFIKRIMK